ncbi:uncharacterized protein LOC5512102 [Nematostella vectensis]|uniref:uncharacterized protein LOC5512102 n=1 Tax=Nematostella vectensis TaxID=45351 RepID=UPI00207780CA|nr:uncharacterized protein LOC5512102 [Nematostella vectensis]
MAGAGRDLFKWNRQTKPSPNYNKNSSVQSWIKNVQRASDNAAREMFGNDFHRVLDQVHVDEDALMEEPQTSTPVGKHHNRMADPEISLSEAGSDQGDNIVDITGSTICRLGYSIVDGEVVVDQEQEAEESEESYSSQSDDDLDESIKTALELLNTDLDMSDDESEIDDISEMCIEEDELEIESPTTTSMLSVSEIATPDQPKAIQPETPKDTPSMLPVPEIATPAQQPETPKDIPSMVPVPEIATSQQPETIQPETPKDIPSMVPVPEIATPQQPETIQPETPKDIPSMAPVPEIATSQQPETIQPDEPEQPGIHLKPECFLREKQINFFREELRMVQSTKVLCSLDLLADEFRKRCGQPGCTEKPTVKHVINGVGATFISVCSMGHQGRFTTTEFDGNGMSVNNLQVAAALLLSGNNFAKIEKFSKFLGLSFISASTFYRVQRLYAIPTINEWWEWMRETIINTLQEQDVVLAGDGQCDSQGFSAKNLCYFLMEIVTGYILEVEIMDKRHVNMKSATMERKALDNALSRVKKVLSVTEVCTDASSSIKKMIGIHMFYFKRWDVWHKAKSIRKCLLKVHNTRENGKVGKWTDHIIRHFWHCCSVCGEGTSTDEEALERLKNQWISLLHHVCNTHEWPTGKCHHGDLPDEHELPWFDRRDKDFQALQKVILEPSLLDSFKSYVRFRHTGALECANSLSLAYAPKRCAFSYEAYKARKQPSAIDWNFHQGREKAVNNEGEQMVSRKYNRRTKEWNLRIIKVGKTYDYIPMLMAMILRKRFTDIDGITRHVSLAEDDPARIQPTLAMAKPVSSRELFQAHQSRFRPPSTENE